MAARQREYKSLSDPQSRKRRAYQGFAHHCLLYEVVPFSALYPQSRQRSDGIGVGESETALLWLNGLTEFSRGQGELGRS